VTNSESIFELVGNESIFDHQHRCAVDARMVGHELQKLLVDRRAARTLRAMLQKHDWSLLRTMQKLFQVPFLAQFKVHNG